MLRLLACSSCLAVVVALAVASAGAEQSRGPISLDDLTRNALVIVEGKVESVASAWNADRTQIRTTVHIKADAFYKGDEGVGAIDIVLLGGAVGEDGLAIIGQPEFRSGEHVFVFLRADWKGNDVPVVQMDNGKFTVSTKDDGTEILVNAVGARYAKTVVLASIGVMNSASTGGRP